MITGIVIGASFLALAQIGVVLIGWRLARLRGDALVVVEEPKSGTEGDVWAGLDRALAEPWDDDEVTAVADAVDVLAATDNDEVIDWLMWEAEFGERAQ